MIIMQFRVNKEVILVDGQWCWVLPTGYVGFRTVERCSDADK
jgi:hypothetical protein